MARILILDIETSPNLAYVWGQWKQNIGGNMFIEKSYIMSFAAKWLDEKKVFYEENRHADDKKLVEALFVLLDEADIVIAHNGDKFDLPRITGRGLVHGLKPPSPYHTIDTLKVARRKFGFLSNKLSELAKELRVKEKGEHKKFAGFDLWKECLKQNDEAWEEMKEYNINDIQTLEEIYLKFRPYITNHPSVIREEANQHICPSCGSSDHQKRGFHYSKLGVPYQRYQCNDCGSWSQERRSDVMAPSGRSKVVG